MARFSSPLLSHVKQWVAAVPTELFLSIAPKPDGCEPELENRQKRPKVARSKARERRMGAPPPPRTETGTQRATTRVPVVYLHLAPSTTPMSRGGKSYPTSTTRMRTCIFYHLNPKELYLLVDSINIKILSEGERKIRILEPTIAGNGTKYIWASML